MKQCESIIIGGGPAGLRAAKALLESGARVCLIDRNASMGGQLIKQTHMFFGSEKQHASTRGISIQHKLLSDVMRYGSRIEILSETHVVGVYQDKVIACMKDDQFFKMRGDAIIIATGASEKHLPFENNDLPGVYAAGAVQTLMNEYGIKPGHKVLMVGSGNIGLIVSYQLMQAGVEVVALAEAASQISGYHVHASKIKRHGVDILTNTSIKRALGETEVTGAELWKLDESWQGIEGSEWTIDLDTICISVGLAPLSELFQQVGANVEYVRELGGNVPVIDNTYQTTIDGVYACGDAVGIEEASSAMVEGEMTGIYAAHAMAKVHPNETKRLKALEEELAFLRSGPHAEKIRVGYKKRGEVS